MIIPAVAADHALRWEQSDDGVMISENGSKVLYYQRSDKSKDGKHTRANYVHPLYDFEGNVLTEDFPDDHRHHRGVFWAWHQLSVGGQTVGDGWAIQAFRWDVRQLEPKSNDDGSVTLDSTVHWKSSQWRNGEEPVVVEKTSIRIYPREGGRRRIDFDIRLQATNPETFIGGSDDEKGYGGFSVRLKLPKDIRFTSQNGLQTPAKGAMEPAPWMSMTGSLGDVAADRAGASGLAVLCHPDSVGYPQPWILRAKRSMQNPVWPGRQPTLLPTDDPLVLRYRLVIHRDPVTSQVIQQWHQEYAQLP